MWIARNAEAQTEEESSFEKKLVELSNLANSKRAWNKMQRY